MPLQMNVGEFQNISADLFNQWQAVNETLTALRAAEAAVFDGAANAGNAIDAANASERNALAKAANQVQVLAAASTGINAFANDMVQYDRKNGQRVSSIQIDVMNASATPAQNGPVKIKLQAQALDANGQPMKDVPIDGIGKPRTWTADYAPDTYPEVVTK